MGSYPWFLLARTAGRLKLVSSHSAMLVVVAVWTALWIFGSMLDSLGGLHLDLSNVTYGPYSQRQRFWAWYYNVVGIALQVIGGEVGI